MRRKVGKRGEGEGGFGRRGLEDGGERGGESGGEESGGGAVLTLSVDVAMSSEKGPLCFQLCGLEDDSSPKTRLDAFGKRKVGKRVLLVGREEGTCRRNMRM